MSNIAPPAAGDTNLIEGLSRSFKDRYRDIFMMLGTRNRAEESRRASANNRDTVFSTFFQGLRLPATCLSFFFC
jgi:hypothetical protein